MSGTVLTPDEAKILNQKTSGFRGGFGSMVAERRRITQQLVDARDNPMLSRLIRGEVTPEIAQGVRDILTQPTASALEGDFNVRNVNPAEVRRGERMTDPFDRYGFGRRTTFFRGMKGGQFSVLPEGLM